MTEPVWLTIDIVVDVHAEQLAIFGGPDGIRDLGLLESALGRPRNKYAYGDEDLASLAAVTFPGLPLVGYESGDELKAARKAGYEVGDPLRVWVVARQ